MYKGQIYTTIPLFQQDLKYSKQNWVKNWQLVWGWWSTWSNLNKGLVVNHQCIGKRCQSKKKKIRFQGTCTVEMQVKFESINPKCEQWKWVKKRPLECFAEVSSQIQHQIVWFGIFKKHCLKSSPILLKYHE